MGRHQRNRERHAAPETVVVSEERIRARAYEIWLQKGALNGSDIEDWLEAEREILSETAPPRTASGAAA